MDTKYIFGLHPVQEALEGETEISKLYISQTGDFKRIHPLEQLAIRRNISVTKVPNIKLDKMVSENHQGIIALCSPIKYWHFEVLLKKVRLEEEKPLILFLDGVTDTRNLGGIARSAACLGVKAIVLPIQGSAAVTQDTVKTSAGAILKIPVARVSNSKLAVHTAMAEEFKIVSVSEKGNTPISEFEYNAPTMLLFGGEQKGISPALIKLSDCHANIPMSGGVSSLNVSVAVGITCYELHMQRLSQV